MQKGKTGKVTTIDPFVSFTIKMGGGDIRRMWVLHPSGVGSEATLGEACQKLFWVVVTRE